MEGQRALSGTNGNKLTVASVTRRVQEVTRGTPYVASFQCARPERTMNCCLSYPKRMGKKRLMKSVGSIIGNHDGSNALRPYCSLAKIG